jgi:hypothetical protein
MQNVGVRYSQWYGSNGDAVRPELGTRMSLACMLRYANFNAPQLEGYMPSLITRYVAHTGIALLVPRDAHIMAMLLKYGYRKASDVAIVFRVPAEGSGTTQATVVGQYAAAAAAAQAVAVVRVEENRVYDFVTDVYLGAPGTEIHAEMALFVPPMVKYPGGYSDGRKPPHIEPGEPQYMGLLLLKRIS